MKTAKIATFGTLFALAAILTGCSTIADIQTKNSTKTLPDGSTLHYNTNVVPTPDWGCTAVGTP